MWCVRTHERYLQPMYMYSLKTKFGPDGNKLSRSVVIHYLSIEEFHQRCKDNFELSLIRADLIKTINNTDNEQELAVVVITRCGKYCLFTMKLVPEYSVSLKLAGEYKDKDALQLNID